MQRSAPVYSRHHLEVRAVEAVHSDHTGLGVKVTFIRVGGIEVILKYRQTVQVLNLKCSETTKQQNYLKKESFLKQAAENAEVLSKTAHGARLMAFVILFVHRFFFFYLKPSRRMIHQHKTHVDVLKCEEISGAQSASERDNDREFV